MFLIMPLGGVSPALKVRVDSSWGPLTLLFQPGETMYQYLSHRPPTILLAVATLCIGLALPTISIAGDAVFIDSAQIKVSGNRSDANLGKSTSGAGD